VGLAWVRKDKINMRICTELVKEGVRQFLQGNLRAGT
jgi:hypothetical protein